MRIMQTRLWLLMVGVALALTGCGGGSRAPAGSDAAPGAPIVEAPIPAPAAVRRPPGLGAPRNSQARNLVTYKTEFAERLYEGNTAQVFSGTPPHALRSIVVLNLTIDVAGAVRSVRVFRDNGDDETRDAAVASVHRAAPYPRPAAALLRGGQMQFTETWLFRDDGQFQLRSMAEAYQK